MKQLKIKQIDKKKLKPCKTTTLKKKVTTTLTQLNSPVFDFMHATTVYTPPIYLPYLKQ